MISDAANGLAGLVSKVALQTRAVVMGTNVALRMHAALVAVIVTTLALALSTSARAATITVNSLAATGAPGICVLRDAIKAANTMTATNGCAAGTGDDTIQFSVTGTILLASTLPQVTDTQLTINGPATPGITISGGGQVQVMHVASNAEVNLSRLTIANGTFFGGGGILNDGTLTVTNSTFSGNIARYNGDGGGAVLNHGTLTVAKTTFFGNNAFSGGAISNVGFLAVLTVTNSTFSGNSAGIVGGAIAHEGTGTVTNSTFSGNSASSLNGLGGSIWNLGTLTVTNSTFSDNSSGHYVDGIYNGGTLTVTNTILANSTPDNCGGRISDAGYNISDDSSCRFSDTGSHNNTDPQLDPAGLADNGGPTQTIALLSGSPAIDAIPVADCTDQASPPNPIITDQRLFPRPDAGEDLCDIGAYEFADTPSIPFSRFSGSLTIDSNTRALHLNGSFNLGTGGSIDPTTQPVAFSVGRKALRLSVGSFVQNATGYVYQKIGRSILRVSIQFTNTPGSYRLLVFQQGAPQFTSPVPVTLTIGNNSGSTLMNVKSD